MPQLFQVLRCFKCLTFQVYQTKKSNKFLCKICNEKQSTKRHYGIGTAKDCRIHVQKLNKMRAEKDEITLEESSEEYEELNTSVNDIEDMSDNKESGKRKSKWLSYIDKDELNEYIEETPNVDQSINKTALNDQWKTHNSRMKRKEKCQNDKGKRKNNTSTRTHDNSKLNYSESKNLLDDNNKDENDGNVVLRKSFSIKESSCTLTNNARLCNDLDFQSKDGNVETFASPKKRPKFETPKVATSSKWAQFVGEEEGIVEDNILNEKREEKFSNKLPTLFSLCDESDIDDVFNI